MVEESFEFDEMLNYPFSDWYKLGCHSVCYLFVVFVTFVSVCADRWIKSSKHLWDLFHTGFVVL